MYSLHTATRYRWLDKPVAFVTGWRATMTGDHTEAAIAPAHHLAAAHPPVIAGQSSGTAAAAAMLLHTNHHDLLLTGSLTAGGRAVRSAAQAAPSAHPTLMTPMRLLPRCCCTALSCMLCCVYCPAEEAVCQRMQCTPGLGV